MNEDIANILGLVIENMNENYQLPDPNLLIHYENQDERCIWIEGEIGDELTYFTKLIFKWNAEDDGIPQEERKPIKIFLHTPGGQLDVALGLCDAILTSKTPVWTINAGWAMSSGTLILVCGQKRFCMKNSAALIHSTSGGSSGTMQQVKDSTQFMEKLDTLGNKLLLERTEIPQRTLSAKKKNDWLRYNLRFANVPSFAGYRTTLVGQYGNVLQ